jgi:chromosome partitioning protein
MGGIMKTISFNTTKGGTGKTTCSILTLNSLTKAGFKCLAIDTDMINHSLSFYYNTGIDFEIIQQKNIFKLFIGEPVEDNIIPISDNLDLIHSDVRLSDFRSIDSLKRLKKSLEPIKNKYDFIIIDTAPTYDNITANIFKASDYLFIPVVPDLFNYQSVKYLFGKLQDLELDNLNLCVLFNKYVKPRNDNPDLYSNQIIDVFKQDKIMSQFISDNYISKSNHIKKYIDDREFRLSNSQKTIKQFTEIKQMISASLSIGLNINSI